MGIPARPPLSVSVFRENASYLRNVFLHVNSSYVAARNLRVFKKARENFAYDRDGHTKEHRGLPTSVV